MSDGDQVPTRVAKAAIDYFAVKSWREGFVLGFSSGAVTALCIGSIIGAFKIILG